MGLLARTLGVKALSMEDPAQPLLPPGALFESLGLGRSDAGVLVNEQQAMRITTAQACVRIISEDLASNAHEVLQELPDESTRIAKDHRLWPILHDEPNPRMSAKTFWGALMAAAVGSGNGYAWIKRDGAARAVALIPLKSGLTAPVKLRGQLMYATTQTDTGAVAYIDPENMLHVMGLTFDGILGINPIQTCMNAFGLALAAEKFGAQFFGNGARSTGVFTHPGHLEDEAYQNLKKSIREWATGENALRPLVLEEGVQWNQQTIPPNEAQFLQTRQYQRTEIAGLWRVPLHLIGDLQRATNNNIEHQSLDYVRYCLRPWAVALEQEVNRKLLTYPYVMEHNFNDMQRGDFASQTAGFQTLRNIGVYSANRILRKMRENPIPKEEGGDVLTVQGAMINVKALLDAPAADETGPATPDDTPDDSQPFDAGRRILGAYRSMFRDAVGRSIHRGGEAVFTRRAFQPLVSSMAQALLALRFGNSQLTQREQMLISAVTSAITDGAAGWQKKDATALAGRLALATFESLKQELAI